MRKIKSSRVALNLVFILMTFIFIFPLFVAIMISISTESDVITFGYSIIPKNISFESYKTVFKDGAALVKAYGITILSATIGSIFTVILCTTIGYALSQKAFVHKKIVMIYIVITMLFGGGLIPTYILNTQVLGLGNNLAVHLVLGLVSGSNIILFKIFFAQIPASLIEAADIDGASQWQVLYNVIIPMSKPIVAMVFFNTFLGRWNNFETSMYYITDKNLYSLQYFLNKIISDSEFVRKTYQLFNISGGSQVPVETLKFAVCVVGALPVLIIFPMVQKYFSKGIAVGSVKG